MKKNIFLLFLFFGISINATSYYVTTTGDNSNNGLTEATAWKTIVYATQQVSSGDIVYVKAGTYNGEFVNIPSGLSGSSITFEGYNNSPGDVTDIDWWNYETNRTLDPTKMPLLDGGNRASGTAISTGSYVIVKNFQITKYEIGIQSWSNTYCTFKNLIITTIGNISDSYSGVGVGIYNGGDNPGYDTLQNCVVLNAAAEGFMIYSSDNEMENCKTYCDDTTNTNANTDYYFEVEGNNNKIRNCYIERVGNLNHQGHGFTIKGDGHSYSGNLFENCEAKNLEGGGFVVRHRGVTNNVFRGCKVYDAVGFLIRDGASYNNFYNCTTSGCDAAILMFDSDEDGGTQYAGRFNDFYNSLFKNSATVLDFNSYSANSDANNNRLINCIIDGATDLFNCDRTNYNNEMINCIVSNVSNQKIGSYSLNLNFLNTDFYNNGFVAPSGTNILSADPKFVDTTNNDYHLLGISPCIDAGKTDTTGLKLPNSDADGNTRITDGTNSGSAIIDMGIYELPTPAPVELSSFSLSSVKNGVSLTWVTSVEINNYGFDIEASNNSKTWTEIGFVQGHGNSNSPKDYNYFVETILAQQYNSYRLKQIDFDGKYKYSGIVSSESEKNKGYKLAQNYPNPFNPSTVIKYYLPKSENIDISVFNILGEKVSELVNANMNAGYHSVTFDASNLSNGIYFYKISANNFRKVRKMILLK